MNTIIIDYYESPAGKLILGSLVDKLCLCDWMLDTRRITIDKRIKNRLNAIYKFGNSAVIKETVKELNEYFERKRTTFDIPLLFSGTEFQNKVWKELLEIPYGDKIPYSELARRMGNPKASRAVAAANGANPISILIPCHRVIGSNNKLVGYGGGLKAKQILLNIEERKKESHILL